MPDPLRLCLREPAPLAGAPLPAGATASPGTATSGRRPRVLFLEHAASRNGASLLLLDLLRWLQAEARPGIEGEVLCESRGPLLDEFRALATTHAWLRPYRLQRSRPGVDTGGPAGWLAEGWFRAFLRWRGIDLVYANTAATWPRVAATLRSPVPVLWHIHELPYALDMTLDAPARRGLLGRAQRVVAVSQQVADALATDYGVARSRIDLVRGFVPPPRHPASAGAALRGEVLAELGWPADSWVVGACGGLGWRKGSDLFLQLAGRLLRARLARPVRFLWVGGGAAGEGNVEARRFRHDMQALGLQGPCRHVAATDRVDRYYAAMDVFALTSREDPFPLVVLEAAGHGVPTVAFAGAGGAPEFVADDAGLVVPYLDLDAFAGSLVRLCRHPTLRAALGEAARRKVSAENRVQTQGPLLLGSMRRCLARDAVVG